MYWEKIQGFFNFDNIYSDMVRMHSDGAVFVEIGAWKGRSSIYMAEEIQHSGKKISFYTVDTFLGTEDEHETEEEIKNGTLYETYLKNIEPVKDIIKTIHKDSKDAYADFADESIDFLFIDGDHTYKGMLKDLQLWHPKVKKGGIIGGHDYTETTCGVKMAVDQYFLFSGIEINRTSWVKRNKK